MHFSVEVYGATADLERMMNGEEPHGPIFVTRQEAVSEYHSEIGRKASATRRKR